MEAYEVAHLLKQKGIKQIESKNSEEGFFLLYARSEEHTSELQSH